MSSIRKLLPLSSSVSRTSAKNRTNRAQEQVSYEVLEPKQLLATIAWTSGDILSSSDVSTNGTSVFAINSTGTSGATTTVNGVEFVNSTRANAAALSQAQSLGNESLSVTLGNSNSSAFLDGGLGSIGDLIEGGWWGGDGTGNTASVNLTGLVPGDVYELQFFANDARDRADFYTVNVSDGAGGFGTTLQLSNQVTATGNPAGDFGIGTFTADASGTQSFELNGFIGNSPSNGRIQVNAIQLRRIVPVVLVPGVFPVINEFSTSNNNILEDDNGNSTDWIEIFNAGQDSLNLAGYSLTDDPTDPTK